MAIAVINSTYSSSSGFISIPSTTAGNTLIVQVCMRKTTPGALSSPIVSDGFGNTLINISGAINNDTDVSTTIHYETNISGGITFMIVDPFQGGTIFTSALVLECSGVNQAAPVELGAILSHNSGTSITSTPGPTLTSAFSNPLFVSCIIMATGFKFTSVNSPWTYVPLTSNVDSKLAYVVNTSPQTATFNLSASTAFHSASSGAIFNPTPNSFTINLNDSVTSNDSISSAEGFARSLADSLGMSDVLNLVLSTNQHFKTLFDTIAASDTITSIFTAYRTLLDSVILLDSIDFVHETNRTFTDQILVKDWMGIKKSGNHWGS